MDTSSLWDPAGVPFWQGWLGTGCCRNKEWWATPLVKEAAEAEGPGTELRGPENQQLNPQCQTTWVDWSRDLDLETSVASKTNATQQPTRIDRKAGQAIPPAALDPQIRVFHPFEGLDTFILACGKSLIVSWTILNPFPPISILLVASTHGRQWTN